MDKFKIRWQQFSWREAFVSILPVLLVLMVSAWAIYRFVDPAPSKHIVISTGEEDSDYNDYAKSYQELLAQDGITLEIMPSAGAAENLARLRDPNGTVDVAFLQDGLDGTGQDQNDQENQDNSSEADVLSLGSVSYEPIWVFYRSANEISRVDELKGKRIGVGGNGSGTRLLSTRLLQSSGVNAKNATLVEARHTQLIEMMQTAKLDAAFFVGSPAADVVTKLAGHPGIRIMSFDQADATARNIPFLHHVVIPHGTLNLQANIPSKDLHMLSTTTTVAVRDSLHPALVALLMKAMHKTHSEPDLINAAHEFPAARDVDLPLSKDAERYYKSGPPFLQRYLPFWLATLLDRIGLVLIPVLAVMIPVVRTVPQLYAWRVRRRIYRWYGELAYLETLARNAATDAERKEISSNVDAIEEKVAQAKLPTPFTDHLYGLREHIDFVRRKISTNPEASS